MINYEVHDRMTELEPASFVAKFGEIWGEYGRDGVTIGKKA